MAQTIKMIFPPPAGSALHNKIVANERDRKEFEGGYLRVERFLQIYKDEIKNKRALYLVQANSDVAHLKHQRTRASKKQIFKFGIAGTSTGNVEGRFKQYLHYHGHSEPVDGTCPGVRIYLLLVTQWRPYDGVAATSTAIHKLELDLKRKLRFELANEHGLPKKDRGSERLKIGLDKIKDIIDKMKENFTDAGAIFKRNLRSGTRDPGFQLKPGMTLKVVVEFELPNYYQSAAVKYRVGERYKIIRKDTDGIYHMHGRSRNKNFRATEKTIKAKFDTL